MQNEYFFLSQEALAFLARSSGKSVARMAVSMGTPPGGPLAVDPGTPDPDDDRTADGPE